MEKALERDVDEWCYREGIPQSSVNLIDDKCATTIKQEDLDLTTTYSTCIFNGNRFVVQFSVTPLILTFQSSSISITDELPLTEDSDIQYIPPLESFRANITVETGPVLHMATVSTPGRFWLKSALTCNVR